MKKLLVYLMVLCAPATTVFAQNKTEEESKASKAPDAVTTAFAKQYGNIPVKWEKEGNNYEGGFKQNGKETSAVYTGSGKLIETEVAIPVSELPAAAATYLQQQGLKAKEAAKITDAAGKVTYEAEVKGKDLLFDANGKFIK